MLTAVTFHKEIRAGSSLPLIVGASDGNKYVVKLRGAGDGVLANVVEWLAAKLGYCLDIPVICPVLLRIDPAFDDHAWDPEIRELLQKSIGINLGTPYFENASIYDESAASGLAAALKNEIFFYDLFLLNIDRTAENPNMIVHRGELRCLDYSSAMMMRGVITAERYREPALLRQLKRHPFYPPTILPYDFINKLRRIAGSDIQALVNELPEEWLAQVPGAPQAGDFRKIISARVIDKKNHGEALLRMMDLLKIFKLETAAEREERSLQNRQAFERKHGRLWLASERQTKWPR